MHDIRKLSRRTVYKNRWMKVHEDAVGFPDGSEGIYGVVDKEDFALIVPRHGEGRYQLVQQYRYPVGGRFWEFPQGSWETRPGSNPEEVALGELEEETGLRASSLVRLGHLYEAYGYSNQGFHVFLATGLREGNINRDREGQHQPRQGRARHDHGVLQPGGNQPDDFRRRNQGCTDDSSSRTSCDFGCWLEDQIRSTGIGFGNHSGRLITSPGTIHRKEPECETGMQY